MSRVTNMWMIHRSNDSERCPRCNSIACGLGKICSACGVDKVEFLKKKSSK